MTFSRVGRLTGLAGAFPVADSSPKSAARWLLTHREMFGLGAEDELAVREPTDREEALGQRAADGEPSARPGHERDAEPSRAIVRTFEVVHQGCPALRHAAIGNHRPRARRRAGGWSAPSARR
jgi:hypothetical protein